MDAPTNATRSAAPASDIGDIEIKKKNSAYNTYTCRFSMGQLQAIHAALSKDHASPLADELVKLLEYYLKTVPGPGEEEEDIKAQDEQDAIGGGEGEEQDDGLPIPMPPGYKGDGRTTVAGEGEDTDGEGMGGGEPPMSGGEPPMGGGRGGHGAPGREAPTSLPGGEEEMPEEDQRLPAPPRE